MLFDWITLYNSVGFLKSNKHVQMKIEYTRYRPVLSFPFQK